MYIFIFITLVLLILLIVAGIITMIILQDISLLPETVFMVLLAIVLCYLCHETRPHSGVITDIQMTDGTSVSKVIDGEIEYVTEYQYIILIKTEDGEYRTMTSRLGEDWSHYEEGEMITYTLGSTFEIEEE